jgi:hypothetical protein
MYYKYICKMRFEDGSYFLDSFITGENFETPQELWDYAKRMMESRVAKLDNIIQVERVQFRGEEELLRALY